MLISLLMMTIGITYIIMYINLFTFGYTIKEYVFYILKQPECYLFIIGLIIQIIIIYTWKGKKT